MTKMKTILLAGAVLPGLIAPSFAGGLPRVALDAPQMAIDVQSGPKLCGPDTGVECPPDRAEEQLRKRKKNDEDGKRQARPGANRDNDESGRAERNAGNRRQEERRKEEAAEKRRQDERRAEERKKNEDARAAERRRDERRAEERQKEEDARAAERRREERRKEEAASEKRRNDEANRQERRAEERRKEEEAAAEAERRRQAERRETREERRDDARRARVDRLREERRDRVEEIRERAREQGRRETLREVRQQRRERREDGRLIIDEGDGRTIITRRNGDVIIRNDESDRIRRNARDIDERRLPNGLTETIVYRPDGVQVITLRDRDGFVLRRTRVLANGQRYVLFSNQPGYWQRPDEYIVTLPPPVISIPRDRYIVEAEAAPPELIYETFAAPPVQPVERRYALDQVVNSPDLLDRVRRVDIDSITFETGSWTVDGNQVDALDAIAESVLELIDKNPNEVFLVEGHTDAVGADVDNLSLSDRRAEEVAYLLTEYYDVPAENLTTKGYGEMYLKVATEGPSRENRRVTMRRITPLLETAEAR